MTSSNTRFANFIGGDWHEPCGKRTGDLYDPATGQDAGRLPYSSGADVDRAVRAAAGSGWMQAGKAARLSALAAMTSRIRDRRADFAERIAAELGAPGTSADQQHVGAALDHLQAIYDALAVSHDDQTPWSGRDDHRVLYKPLGVAALITPWNWPLNQVVLKVAAALGAACPMVLKPSELTPRTSMLLAEVMAEITPPGVFNMVLGDGEVGAALVAHEGIDVISFTGSTAVGRSIGAVAGQALKPVGLELGGKSPNILFADCDLPLAIRQGVAHCFRNGGQSCNAASRMLVEQSIYAQAVELAAAEAAKYRPAADYGPIISARHYERVQKLIAAGEREGARLVAGGPGIAQAAGFYPKPTIFADVTPEMTIFREEIFGPVLTMTPFADEARALSLANDSAYGLAAYVQTSDPVRADRVARELQAGMVQVNGSSRAPGAPFGGIKASGIGREAGLWGIRAFQSVRSLSGVVADGS